MPPRSTRWPLALVALGDGEGGADQGLGLDADQHHAVAQPLLDPDAEHRRDLPHRGAEDLELVDGPFVAVVVDEVGEPAEVDERERAVDPVVHGDRRELCGVQHACSLDAHEAQFATTFVIHVHMSSAIRQDAEGAEGPRRSPWSRAASSNGRSGSLRSGSGQVSDRRVQCLGPISTQEPGGLGVGAQRRSPALGGRRRGEPAQDGLVGGPVGCSAWKPTSRARTFAPGTSLGPTTWAS